VILIFFEAVEPYEKGSGIPVLCLMKSSIKAMPPRGGGNVYIVPHIARPQNQFAKDE
jgi:hypothetical protein